MIFEKHLTSGRKLFATTFAAACLALTACDSAILNCQTDCPADPIAATDLVSTATAAGNFTTLLAALEAADLSTVLSDPNSNFTVFAPTDDAFAALGQAAVDALLADSVALNDTLLYHVLPGSVDGATATGLAGTAITMQNNKDASLSLDGTQLMINAANITSTDIMASNGIIHVIDAVLTPPAEVAPVNLVQTAVDAGNFTTLVAALETANLDQVLADETQTFTVFAPTDNAFAALGQGAIDTLLADATLLNDTLLYHVLPGSVDAAAAIDLAPSDITMQNGVETSLSLSAENVLMINSANVTVTDIVASNGIIHVIDAVLTVPGNTVLTSDLMTTLEAQSNYSSLLSALQTSGLDAVLSDTGKTFTLFAPTNAAFAAADAAIQAGTAGNAAAMEALLLGHVISGTVVTAADATALVGSTVNMTNGTTPAITSDNGALKIGNATIIETDITASNGVIHGIDSVLLAE